MSFAFFIAAMVCLLGTVASLFGGLVFMTKGGSKDHQASNKMMQLRIALQGAAVVFLLLSYLAR